MSSAVERIISKIVFRKLYSNLAGDITIVDIATEVIVIIGYARVSTSDQSTDMQVAALKAAGAEKVFAENASGVNFKRPALHEALDALQEGDVLLVTRLDRLARSTADLLMLLDRVAKSGAAFRSLNEAWADTTTAAGRLMVTVIGGIAEFERELILARTAEGRARAIAGGVKFGRPPKMTATTRNTALQLIANGMQQAEVARLSGVSPATICVMVREARERAAQLQLSA